MRRHYVEVLLIWIFVIGFWIYSGTYDRPILGSEISIVAWPRGLLVLIALAALFHLLTEARRERREALWRTDPTQPDPLPHRQNHDLAHVVSEHLRPAAWAGLTLAIPVAYVWCLPRYGFFISSPFFVIAMMLAFREYRWVHLLLTSFVIVFSISFIFTKLLFLPLPTGNVPGFYEINVHIVETVRRL